MTPEEERARNRRNLTIALGLVGFVVLVFLVTVAQMRAGSMRLRAGEAHAGAQP